MSNLTLEEVNFLKTLNLDPNSDNLKTEIETFLNSQNIKNTQPGLSSVLIKIYTQIIPNLQAQGKTWDIDYSFERNEKKRRENLKKRGCTEILEVE